MTSQAGDFNSTAVLGGLAVILAGLMIAMFRALSTKVDALAESHVRIETLLTMAVGKDGDQGEFGRLRIQVGEIAKDVGPVILEFRDRRRGERRTAD